MKAWHFLRSDGCLNYPPHTKVYEGLELEFSGEPILCKQGYHASKRLLDALMYAPGSILTYCEVSGTVVHGEDKLVATKRKVLWMKDISTLLHEFACDEAELALNNRKIAGHKIDHRSVEAIRIKRLWLNGEATDKQLDAARDAAKAAAWDAARAAAWDAARAATGTAAWAAAKAAAWDAARDAAWDAQNKRLTRRVRDLMKL